jgi:glycosyltransferase involved in cell wall biosynthesis
MQKYAGSAVAPAPDPRILPTVDYSIIIPAFNEANWLPASLRAARAAMATVPEWQGEIVVVDNHSTDNTAEVARAGGARVVYEEHNQISRARNRGAQAAAGRWFVFVDADTCVDGGLLRAILTLLASDRCAGGGVVMRYDVPLTWLPRLLLGAWNRLSRTCHLAAGGCLFCRRDAFTGVGGFSERVYASEEIWFSRAVRRWARTRGQTFTILPGPPAVTSARKLHWHPTTTIAGMLLIHLLLPFTVRWRRWCWFWYVRPAPPPDPD